MKNVVLSKDLRQLFPERESFLDRTDLKVHLVASNDEVQRLIAREDIDLLVLQLDIPGVSTEDLCELIRKHRGRRGTSIILVCSDTLAHRERSKKCRANAVVTMPVDPVILQMKIQQFLNVAPRMQYRAALAVAIEGKFRDRPVPFETENISSSGMLIRAEEPLRSGAGVFVSFFLPDGTHISGYGEIARVERIKGVSEMYRYGIRFTNMDDGSRTAIEAVVKLRAKGSAPEG